MLKLSKFIPKAVAGLLSLLLALSVVTVPVGAVENDFRATQKESFSVTLSPNAYTNMFDYSFKGALDLTSRDIGDALEQASGITISDAEKAYLASLGIRILYDSALPQDLITVSANGDSVMIRAAQRQYSSPNGGTNIVWTPKTVTVANETKNLVRSDDVYVVSYKNLNADAIYTATFTYEASIRLTSKALAAVWNLAYTDAMDAMAKETAFSESEADYIKALEVYKKDCLEYEKQVLAYNKYKDDANAYTRLLALYQTYLKKVDAYNKAVKDYAQYEKDLAEYQNAYAKYEAEMKIYPEKQAAYEAYVAYLDKINAIMKKLKPIDSAFISDSVGHVMYSTLMGDTVEMVLSKKDELINYGGVDPNDINNAGYATENLRSLLTAYNGIRKDVDRVNWYINNYETVKNNFIVLYSSLANLGNNGIVKSALNSKGKLDRYAQFVGQLYIISTGLDDNATFNASWSYYGQSIFDLVDSSQHIVDSNDYSPVGITMPDPVQPVEKPAVPVAPKKPAEVKKPVQTWTKEEKDPGDPPEKVKEPKKPKLADYFRNLPQAPQITGELRAVMALVESGALQERDPSVLQDVTYTVTEKTEKAFAPSGKPIVEFYDHDGKSLLYAVAADGDVSYEGKLPSRNSDGQYTYTFAGWKNAKGKPVDFSAVKENTVCYAAYDKSVNRYSITWIAAGKTETEYYNFGEVPEFKGNPSYSDDKTEYVFKMWSQAIVPVKEDTTYEAIYFSRNIEDSVHAVTFIVGDEQYYRTYKHGEMPNFTEFADEYIKGGERYVFKGWSPAVAPVTKNTTYTAVFEKSSLIPAGEDGKAKADLTVSDGLYTITTEATVVNAAYAVKNAIADGAALTLEMNGMTITLDASVLAKMPTAAWFKIVPGVHEKSNVDYAPSVVKLDTYTLEISDNSGKPVELAGEALIEIPLGADAANGGKLNAYLNGILTDASIHDGVVFMRINTCGTVSFVPYYDISVNSEGEGGDMLISETSGELGSKITWQSNVEKGYCLAALYISENDAEEVKLEIADGYFIMPDGNVHIRAVFEKAEYTVKFIANGVELGSAVYHYGDAVTEPDIMQYLSYEKDGVTYTFSGWDSTVSAVMEDKVYTAVYKEGEIGEYESPYNSNKMLNTILPIVGGVVVLLVAGFFVFMHFYKKKKKERNSTKTNVTDTAVDNTTDGTENKN